jgi:GTPase SAR1 family protein
MEFDDFESILSRRYVPLLTYPPATIKIIVVGNGRVGKTSMTTRYCTGEYTAVYKKTIGTFG